MKLKVLKHFADKYDRSIKYEVGDILHTDETERVENLVSRGLVEVVGDENPDDEDETGTKDNAPSDDQGDNQGEDAGSTVEDPAAGQNDGDPETQNEQQDADVQNGTEDPSGDAPSDTDEAPSDAEKATKKSPKKKED